MNIHSHPIYQEPAQVRALTEWHLASGHSVFQLFQFEGGEAAHSEQVLQLADLPEGARVLSLGCGVAGMEAHWHRMRPDLSFELVNISAEQHALALCDGVRVTADAQGYVSERAPFDCVVVAYMLGHVDALATLDSAAANLKSGGKLVVLDVFDSSAAFDSELIYDSPRLADVEAFAVCSDMRLRVSLQGGLGACEQAMAHLPASLLAQTTPAVFVLEAP